jgi:hypothetical protein
VFEWNDPDTSPADTRERVKASLDQGYPVLAMASHLDLGVVFGYEDDANSLLVSDYWASDYPERRAIADFQQIGCFLDHVQAPAPRANATRAGLALSVSRFREGLVDPDPITGASYYYGAAGFERWQADLERVPELSAQQLSNLFHVSSWTFSTLYQGRTKHAPDYLRRASRHFSEPGGARLLEAAALYDRVADRLGPWDASDPIFGMVKQRPLATWTDEVIRREIALLGDLRELEERAISAIEKALAVG